VLAGSGKQMRHMKIRPGEPVPYAAVRKLLETAWPPGLAAVQARHSRKPRFA
jgi:hypothetical protein